jgi:hypothetical protein
MAETKVYLSNDAVGITNAKSYFTAMVQGDVTADKTAMPLIGCIPQAGTITNVWGAIAALGADGAAALDMKYTVKKNGTAVCSTDPDIAKAAATTARLTTYATATGIVAAVIKTDGTQKLVAGDSITVDFDITRAGTPSPEMNGPSVTVEVTWDAV